MYQINKNNRENVKVEPDKPIDPDLWRIVCSMAAVLKRKYPDASIRQAVSEQIMQELRMKQAA